jgi:23S rRNA pseudouridine1911/1915/1917 synthase
MESHRLVVDSAGERVDLLLSKALPDLSRSQLQRLIWRDLVRLDGRPTKPGARPRPGQVLEVHLPPPEPSDLLPEPMNLAVVYEDPHLIVIDKPPGLVVHPAPGHSTGTLVQGLLHHIPDLKGIGGVERPGIIHRLDKDTSGLIVAAKDDPAHQALSQAFKSRLVEKTYLALLVGAPDWVEKKVEAPLARHPVHRKKMAVDEKGRSAESIFQVRKQLKGPLTLASVRIKTGRTHQIRVHAAHLGHPVLGDPVYGNRGRERNLNRAARDRVKGLDRQMLHAWRLGFDHPISGQRLDFEAPMPPEMAVLVAELDLVSELDLVAELEKE